MIVTTDRCEQCQLYKVETTDICPCCGGFIDMEIVDVTLTWKCRKCDYSISTTANKLCFWDNGKYNLEMYSKYDKCPYAAKI